MKKWDKIIIAVLLIISFLPYIMLKTLFVSDYNMLYAYISVGGKPYKEIPLTGQISPIEFVIETEYGTNTVRIENEQIGIIHADCSDQVCKEFGFKGHPGENIVCLPNKVYIEVKGEVQEESELDFIAH